VVFSSRRRVQWVPFEVASAAVASRRGDQFSPEYFGFTWPEVEDFMVTFPKDEMVRLTHVEKRLRDPNKEFQQSELHKYLYQSPYWEYKLPLDPSNPNTEWRTNNTLLRWTYAHKLTQIMRSGRLDEIYLTLSHLKDADFHAWLTETRHDEIGYGFPIIPPSLRTDIIIEVCENLNLSPSGDFGNMVRMIEDWVKTTDTEPESAKLYKLMYFESAED
jgi:hypothetical protein